MSGNASGILSDIYCDFWAAPTNLALIHGADPWDIYDMEARPEIPIHELGSLDKFCSDMPCITLSISGRSPDDIADLLQTISAAKMETAGSRVSTKGVEKFIEMHLT